MIIREANLNDFKKLYEIGQQTPELKVSSTEEFMDKDDFKSRINNKEHLFLVAEMDKQLIGFICAHVKDQDKFLKKKYACLVYLTILPKYRKQGIANSLYEECIRRLKKMGITNVYGWVNNESDGAIIKFMKKQGFAQGHNYIWMDKKI